MKKTNRKVKPKKILGWHHLIDFHGCDPKILNSPKELRSCLEKAARKGNATVIKSLFHRFSPYGVSGIVVIAESHISIHTWPEYACATMDIFSCTRRMKISVVAKLVGKALSPNRTVSREMIRGRMGLRR